MRTESCSGGRSDIALALEWLLVHAEPSVHGQVVLNTDDLLCFNINAGWSGYRVVTLLCNIT